jgi:hypothetical protein
VVPTYLILIAADVVISALQDSPEGRQAASLPERGGDVSHQRRPHYRASPAAELAPGFGPRELWLMSGPLLRCNETEPADRPESHVIEQWNDPARPNKAMA